MRSAGAGRLLILVFVFVAGCGRDFSLPEAPGSFEVKLSPDPAQVAPFEALTLQASGGRSPYRFAFDGEAGSGPEATLCDESAEGACAYRAGGIGPAADVIVVTDAAGTKATLRVLVGAPLSVVPTVARLLPGESVTLSPFGGAPPYTFALVTGRAGCGGHVDAQGTYTAVEPGSCTDVVLVGDATGVAIVEVTVIVDDGLRVVPEVVSVAPAGEVRFAALGGRPPYRFGLPAAAGEACATLPRTNAEGSSIDPDLGVFHAGPGTPNTVSSELVEVCDAGGRSVMASVTVTEALSATVLALRVHPGVAEQVTVRGGAPPYTFAFAPRGNHSGGRIARYDGLYVPGQGTGVRDALTVTDANGVTVGVGSLAIGSGQAVERVDRSPLVVAGAPVDFITTRVALGKLDAIGTLDPTDEAIFLEAGGTRVVGLEWTGRGLHTRFDGDLGHVARSIEIVGDGDGDGYVEALIGGEQTLGLELEGSLWEVGVFGSSAREALNVGELFGWSSCTTRGGVCLRTFGVSASSFWVDERVTGVPMSFYTLGAGGTPTNPSFNPANVSSQHALPVALPKRALGAPRSVAWLESSTGSTTSADTLSFLEPDVAAPYESGSTESLSFGVVLDGQARAIVAGDIDGDGVDELIFNRGQILAAPSIAVRVEGRKGSAVTWITGGPFFPGQAGPLQAMVVGGETGLQSVLLAVGPDQVGSWSSLKRYTFDLGARPPDFTGLEDVCSELPGRVRRRGLSLGDVNGDGIADLAIAYVDRPPEIRLGLGGGRYETEAGSIARYRNGRAILVADLDSDGRRDVLTEVSPNRYSGLLSGPGGLSVWGVEFRLLSSVRPFASADVMDAAGTLDGAGDGFLDLFFYDAESSTLEIWPGDPYGFNSAASRRFQITTVVPDAKILLVDAGGEATGPDLFFWNTGTNGDRAEFFVRRAGGGASAIKSVLTPAPAPCGSSVNLGFYPVDLVGDGHLDVVVLCRDTTSAPESIRFLVAEGQGSGVALESFASFQQPGPAVPVPAGVTPRSWTPFTDGSVVGGLLGATSASGESTLIVTVDRYGTLSLTSVPMPADHRVPLLEDLDGDGDRDLVVATTDGGIFVVEGQGGGRFAGTLTCSGSSWGDPVGLVTIEEDGAPPKPAIVLASPTETQLLTVDLTAAPDCFSRQSF